MEVNILFDWRTKGLTPFELHKKYKCSIEEVYNILKGEGKYGDKTKKR